MSRPLLAKRGFAVDGQPGARLKTLADVITYAAACGVQPRIDATETQVRRPRAHRVGRRAFMSGRRKQNTIKTTTIADEQGRTLRCGAVRPGRMHDQTAVETEAIADRLSRHPHVQVAFDEGYRGAGHGVPRSGPCPAAQTAQARTGRAGRRLQAGTAQAVVPADLRRACRG